MRAEESSWVTTWSSQILSYRVRGPLPSEAEANRVLVLVAVPADNGGAKASTPVLPARESEIRAERPAAVNRAMADSYGVGTKLRLALSTSS